MKIRYMIALLSVIFLASCQLVTPPLYVNGETTIERNSNGKIIKSVHTYKEKGFTYDRNPDNSSTWSESDRTAWETNTGVSTPAKSSGHKKMTKKELKEKGLPFEYQEKYTVEKMSNYQAQATYPNYQAQAIPAYSGVISNETSKTRTVQLYKLDTTEQLIVSENIQPRKTRELKLSDGTYQAIWYTDGVETVQSEPFIVDNTTNKIYNQKKYSWVQRIYVIP